MVLTIIGGIAYLAVKAYGWLDEHEMVNPIRKVISVVRAVADVAMRIIDIMLGVKPVPTVSPINRWGAESSVG